MKRGTCSFFLVAFGVCVIVLAVLFGLRILSPSGLPAGAIVVPRDAATIEEALRRVEPNGTIALQKRGDTHFDAVVLDVPGLTLIGVGGRPTLVGTGGEPAIVVRADGVTLRNLELTSDGIGLRLEGSSSRIEDVEIRAGSIGIQCAGASRCTVEGGTLVGGQIGMEMVSAGGNRFVDLAVEGASETGVRLLRSWDNTIEEILVSGASTGIALDEGSTGNLLLEVWVEDADVVGIALRASEDNTLSGCRATDCKVGISLEAVTGNELVDCTVERALDAGVILRQSERNRVFASTIEGCAGDGVRLLQSAENTLSANRISDCEAAGIRIEASDRVLVAGNTVDRSAVGLTIDESTGCRLLRNDVSETSVAILLRGSGSHRALDNRIHRSGVGFALIESSQNTILRNRVTETQAEGAVPTDLDLPSEVEGVGIALLDGSDANRVAENGIEAASIGVLVSRSGRLELSSNTIAACQEGLVLSDQGSGVRIEGNSFEANRVGLVQLARPTDTTQVDRAQASLVASNVFVRNDDLDLRNDDPSTLYAAGNWWGDGTETDGASARVQGDVSLEESAWRGTVAVGTQRENADVVLGRVLQVALEEAGYRVIDLIGLGSQASVADALRARDIDLIWWGTGPDHGAALPASEAVVMPIPATRGWTIVVSKELANRLAEPTLSALSGFVSETGENLRYVVSSLLGEAEFSALTEAYGLGEAVVGISWIEAIEEAEAMVKFGASDLAVVGSLEETLSFSGFPILEDDLEVLDAERVALVFQRDLQTRYPGLDEVLAVTVEGLSTDVLHDLNSRVRLLNLDPSAVARDFVEGTRADE